MDTLDDVDIDDDVDTELEVDKLKLKRSTISKKELIIVMEYEGFLKSSIINMVL